MAIIGIYTVRYSDSLIDIIAGTFFICYAPADSETFLSLPEELVGKYMKLYEYPEVFMKIEDSIHSIKLKK